MVVSNESTAPELAAGTDMAGTLFLVLAGGRILPRNRF